MSRIGMIGVGAMGEPIAANLLKKGFDVAVLRSRRGAVVERLQALGAAISDSAADTVAGRDVIILSLPTSREVEQVVDDGIEAQAQPGAIVVDCTTGNPPDTERIAARLRRRKIGFVAAGMTRGVAGAKQGKLAFFIGGDAADVDKAQGVLQATGDTFIQFATAAQAHMAKLISNVLSYASVALVNEALMLGARGGLDLQALYRALSEGAPSKALEAFGSRIVAREYDPPRVTVDHACDDMMLAQGLAAASAAPLFMLSTAQEIYRMASAGGRGERDVSVLGELWRAGAVK